MLRSCVSAHEREDAVELYRFEDWCKNVFRFVRSFADAKGQHEAWVEGKLAQEHIWCDEVELMCGFEDCSLDRFFVLASSRLAPVVLERLKELRSAVEAMPTRDQMEPSRRGDAAYLASEEWRRVQAAAQAVLQAWDPPYWPWSADSEPGCS